MRPPRYTMARPESGWGQPVIIENRAGGKLTHLWGVKLVSHAGRRRLYIWDSVHGRLACRHSLEHLFARPLTGQNDSMHGVLRVLRHLAHMP